MTMIKKFLDKVYFLKIGFTRKIFSMSLIYMSYLLLGAFLFIMLETPEEEKTRYLTRKRMQLTKEMINVLRAANYTDDFIRVAFEEEQSRLMLRVHPQIHGWWQTFIDKTFFAFILITTIGYGNVSPTTSLGQIVCVIYTMLGLPITVIMMRLLSFKFRSCLRRFFKFGQKFYPTSKFMLVVIGILFFFFWTIIFIIISSYVFTLTDGWDFNRGVYFSFVTLSTIGFGDYVAGVSDVHSMDDFYFFEVVLMLIWMFFGLGFVFMVINMLSYVFGVFTFDKLDSKCRERVAARAKMKALLDLIKELNWQLVKNKPFNFYDWDEIEVFKNFLVENPQDITPQMLLNMYHIMNNLKEDAYDHLSSFQTAMIPRTPIMEQATVNIPDIFSDDSTELTFDAKQSQCDYRPEIISLSDIPITAPLNDRKTKSFIYKGKLSASKENIDLIRRIKSAEKSMRRSRASESKDTSSSEDDSTGSTSDEEISALNGESDEAQSDT